MTWTVDSSGTKTPTVPVAATFTNGSANITVTSTSVINDMVVFTTTGTLPTNFVAGTTYFVLTNSGTVITVSGTKGGGSISAGSAGTGTHTATFEHVLAEPTTNATYEFSVDAVNVVNGDLFELRFYDMVDGTNYRQIWKGTYQHVQVNLGKVSPAKAVTTQAKVTLKQLAGTARAFPWSLRRI